MKKLPKGLNISALRSLGASQAARENAENRARDFERDARRYAKLRARSVQVIGEGSPVTGDDLDTLVDSL